MRGILCLLLVAFSFTGTLQGQGSRPVLKKSSPLPKKAIVPTPPKEPPTEPGIETPDVKPPREPLGPIEAVNQLLAVEDNPIVRKRLILSLLSVEQEARPAIPALLLAASPEENDLGVRKAAMTVLLRFPAVDIVEILSQAVRDPNQLPARRRISCKALAAYSFHPTISAEKRKELYRALEEVLIDPEPDVRLAAATSLEAIDRKQTGQRRTIQVFLDLDGLRRLKVTPEQVQTALKKAFPSAQLTARDNLIEWMPSDPGDTTLVSDIGNVPVFERPEGVIFLRDVSRLAEPTTQPKEPHPDSK